LDSNSQRSKAMFLGYRQMPVSYTQLLD